MRLNLYDQLNKNIIDPYSPAQVVKAREYYEKKEEEAAIEEKRKYDQRVQQAANALKRAKEQEEKEARAARRQLAKDLKAANLSTKKAPKKKPNLVVTKAKKLRQLCQKRGRLL